MQHSEQAASVVRLCYFPAGLRCEGVETLRAGLKTLTQGVIHMKNIKRLLGHSVSLSVSLKTSLRQPARPLKAASPHLFFMPYFRYSELSFATPLASVVIRGEVSLDRFCKLLLKV